MCCWPWHELYVCAYIYLCRNLCLKWFFMKYILMVNLHLYVVCYIVLMRAVLSIIGVVLRRNFCVNYLMFILSSYLNVEGSSSLCDVKWWAFICDKLWIKFLFFNTMNMCWNDLRIPLMICDSSCDCCCWDVSIESLFSLWAV